MARLRTQYSTVTSSAGSVVASTTAPSSPHVGLRWYNSATGVTYQYTSDGASSFWLDTSSGGIGTSADRAVDFVGDKDPSKTTNGTGLAIGSVYYNRERNRYFTCTRTNTDDNNWVGLYAGMGGDTVSDVVIGSTTYRVHKFTGTGNFYVDSPLTAVDYIVVGGGGAGGTGNGGGGGGGAGGLLNVTNQSLAVGTYSVVVGEGGKPTRRSVNEAGGHGTDSTFNGSTAGGGAGGPGNDTAGINGDAANGGSGSGSTGTTSGGGDAGSQGTTGAGGAGHSNQGGGGGGAGGAGGAASGSSGGVGGVGVKVVLGLSDTNSTALLAAVSAGHNTGGYRWLAGGGGGAHEGGAGAVGGSGGGGTGSASNTGAPTGATQNTGGGGGGGDYSLANSSYLNNQYSGEGGTGIVIIRYPL